MTTDIQPATLNTVEAARYLGIGRTVLYRLIGRGDVDSFVIGHRRLVTRESLDRYIAEQVQHQG